MKIRMRYMCSYCDFIFTDNIEFSFNAQARYIRPRKSMNGIENNWISINNLRKQCKIINKLTKNIKDLYEN